MKKTIIKYLLIALLFIAMIFLFSLPLQAMTIDEVFADCNFTDQGTPLVDNTKNDGRLITYAYVDTSDISISEVTVMIQIGYYEGYTSIEGMPDSAYYMPVLYRLCPYNFEPVASLEHGEIWVIKMGLPSGLYQINRMISDVPIKNAKFVFLDKYLEEGNPIIYYDPSINNELYDHSDTSLVLEDSTIYAYAMYGSNEWREKYSEEFSNWIKSNPNLEYQNDIEKPIPTETPVVINEKIIEEDKQQISIVDNTNDEVIYDNIEDAVDDAEISSTDPNALNKKTLITLLILLCCGTIIAIIKAANFVKQNR